MAEHKYKNKDGLKKISVHQYSYQIVNKLNIKNFH